MSEKKTFPIPPFVQARKAPAEECPFGPPKSASKTPRDPMLDDDEVQLLFKQYLRGDQLNNPKILMFICRYVTHRNSSQAAKESGIEGTGSYYRQRPEIHACIEALTQRMVLKHGYDSHEIIERVKEISEIDPVVFQNPDGSFKIHLDEIPPEARRAIKKFKAKNIYGEDANGMRIVTGQLIDVELWDKMKAHELLGAEKNIFKKTTVVQHDVTLDMKAVLLESGNRAEERLRLLEARDVSKGGMDEESKASHSEDGWDRD